MGEFPLRFPGNQGPLEVLFKRMQSLFWPPPFLRPPPTFFPGCRPYFEKFSLKKDHFSRFCRPWRKMCVCGRSIRTAVERALQGIVCFKTMDVNKFPPLNLNGGKNWYQRNVTESMRFPHKIDKVGMPIIFNERGEFPSIRTYCQVFKTR